MKKRLVGIDVARAVALLGMFAVHVFPLIDEQGEPTFIGDFFSGSAAPLFAVLAGVSLVLLSSTKKSYSSPIAIRAVLIMFIGIILMSLMTNIAVILIYYGIMFIIAIPFLKMSTKALLWTTSLWFIFSPVVYWLSHGILRARNPDFPAAYPDGFEFLDIFLGTLYSPLTWMTYIFLGMVIAKAVLNHTKLQKILAFVGISTYVLIEFFIGKAIIAVQITQREVWLPSASNISESVLATEMATVAQDVYFQESPIWLFLNIPHSETYMNLLSSSGLAVFIICSFLLLFNSSYSGIASKLTYPLQAMGRIPLTLYSLHIIVIAMVGVSYLPVEPPLLFAIILVLSLITGVFCAFMNKRGPLEALVGKISNNLSSPQKEQSQTPNT